MTGAPAPAGQPAAGPTTRPAPAGPPPVIRKLDEAVVNKIAAGEVIQRPASALKEMLENSLDAGATAVSVVVKEGGNKLLQITDNGSGIRKEDLPILCHRHTTSKLAAFEDLQTLSTLGFRGEALCSISFVAHMAVTTMARGAQYGYRVTYKDSEIEPPGPRPVASLPGTTITVEDLFYNVPTRRKALKSASEEYGLILDVLGRYAVYSTGVAVTCRRQGEARPDIATTAAMSRLDAVRAVYGADVARELLPLKLAVGGGTGPEVPVEGPMGLSVEGLISGANYGSGKKTVLVLFINGRCVDCSPLRRALEGTYAALLPKAARPWLLLDVRLPPRQVEVNMHPTKREVGFMHQAEVIEEIRLAVESRLLASNESRTFATTATLQTQLPFAALLPPSNTTTTTSAQQQQQHPPQSAGGDDQAAEEEEDGAVGGEGAGRGKQRRRESAGPGNGGPEGGQGPGVKRPAGGGAPVPYRPEKLVRVDHRMGTLDAFVTITAKNSSGSSNVPAAAADSTAAARAAAASGSVARRRSAAAAAAGGLSDGGGVLGGLGDTSAGGGRTVEDTQQMQQQQHRSGGGPAAGGGSRVALPPGLVTAAVLGLGPYASGLSAQDEDLDAAAMEDTGVFNQSATVTGGPPAARLPAAQQRRAPPPVVTRDPWVLQLLGEVEAGAHQGLGELLREHTFVGVADGSLALLQHGTRLYLTDVGALSRDLAYQMALRRWDQPLVLALDPPPRVSDLVALGLQVLQARGEWQPSDGSPEELGELVTELLQQQRPALERQVGLVVDEQGCLASVPLLLEGLPPDPARLPDLVVGLARDVDWDSPRERARGIAEALADLYAARPPLLPEEAEQGQPGSASAPRGEPSSGGAEQGLRVDGTAGPGGREAADEEGELGRQSLQEAAGAAGGRSAGGSTSGRGLTDKGEGGGGGGRGDPGTAAAAVVVHGLQRQGAQVEGGTGDQQQQQGTREQMLAAYEYKIRNVILPAMRGCLRPPRERATDGSCVQVAALERLYRIFERC